MKQEDKELLLTDLCARLPYNCKVTIAEGGIDGLQWNNVPLNSYLLYQIEEEDGWEYIKPYLRPMSSMTEDEKGNVNDIIDEFADRWLDSDVAKDKWYATFWQCSEIVNYLNSIHVDYRGLIEKGLAFEAPEGMYKH